MILKVLLGRKTTRKVSAVEVPFGGSKRKISSGAPKWAIQVKILLNDLFKRIKGTFYLLGLSNYPFFALLVTRIIGWFSLTSRGVVVLLFVLLILP